MNTYNISRQEGATKIGVSVKTIDRYVKQGILPAQKIGGKVYLNDDDLFNIKKNSPKRGRRKKMTPQKNQPFSSSSFPKKEESSDIFFSDLKVNKNSSAEFTKQIYTDLQQQLQEKDQLLLAANYKIGKLENKINSSIPLLEMQNKDQEISQIKEKQQEKIISLHKRIQKEIFNRYIYLVIILFLITIEIIIWFLA